MLRGHGYFKRLGPGLITGAADDDPSGIGTYSQVGARFGYALVWACPMVLPMAAAVQEMAARLGLATGRGLGTLIRERFPRWVLVVCVAMLMVANTFNIAADLAAMGASARLVIPLPTPVLTVAMAGIMLGLQIFVPYHRYSRILRYLALSLVTYVVVLFAVDVDWAEVLRNLVPSFDGNRAELAALIAIFGTTVSPYLFFWQASEEVEEEQEVDAGDHAPALTGTHLAAMRVDVIGGMMSAVFIMFAIIVATAATLHVSHLTTITTADQAAHALVPVAGDLAGLVFALGVVGLGLLAVPVLAGSTAYATAEAAGQREGLSRHFREARGFYTVVIASMVLGLALDLGGLDPIRGLYYAAILNGLISPFLILVMFVLARSRRTMGTHRSGWISSTVVLATIFAGVALPAAYVLR